MSVGAGVAAPSEAEAFLESLDDTSPDAVTACRGWTTHELIAELVTHTRPEFIDHSVRLLPDSLLQNGLPRDPRPDEPFLVHVRCAGQQDFALHLESGLGALVFTGPDDVQNVVETDPAARQLNLWGRRPQDARRVRSSLSPADLGRLQQVLVGY